MDKYTTEWVVIAVLIIVFLGILGVVIRKNPLGVFVDDRNRISLSRMQLVFWTVLIISAFFAVAVGESTMDIHLDNALLMLLGISAGSSAGSYIIKGTKSGQQPDSAKVHQSLVSSANRVGVIATSERPSITDMFKGEEITDKDYIDIGKVQMFFFTIAAVVGYLLALWNYEFIANDGIYKFPPLSESVVWLLGISHAGYLTVKAAPKTPSAG